MHEHWTVLNHAPKESQIFQLFFRGCPASGWWSDDRLLQCSYILCLLKSKISGKNLNFFVLCVIGRIESASEEQMPQIACSATAWAVVPLARWLGG